MYDAGEDLWSHSMSDLAKKERYIVLLGTEEHVLRVQELVSGPTLWPSPFRIQLAASSSQVGKTFYGASALEVVERAAQYLSSSVRKVGGRLCA